VVKTKQVNKSIKLDSAIKLVESLAGSVKIPRRFRGLTPDQIIKKAKQEYFQNKK